jgi:hypothetical protein
MRAVRWMAAGLLLAGCSSSGADREGPSTAPPFVGRWNGPRGYTEFGPEGRYEMAVTGGARMTGRYEVQADGLVAITYDQMPGHDGDAMRVTVSGDTLRMCEPGRPELPCATLVRAAP